MLQALVSHLAAYLVALTVQARHPQLVRVDDRQGLLRRCEPGGVCMWADVDFGDGRPAWFPADQVTLLPQGERL